MFKKIYSFFYKLCVILSLIGFFIVFNEELKTLRYFFYSNTDKALIAPYFDETFYLKQYGEDIKKSGLTPLDHFMKKGWHSSNWKNHKDPNPWFNLTLYKERLWYKHSFCSLFETHPFVDYLKQAPIKKHNHTIHVYAKNDELNRAWLAIEGLLHRDEFNVTLHIPNGLDPKELIRFKPQTLRGLVLLENNLNHKSFYQSDFLKGSHTTLKETTEPIGHEPISHVCKDFRYLMHRLYKYTHWYKIGKINPSMINIAHYCDEPLVYARFGTELEQFRIFLKNLLQLKWDYPPIPEQDFKDYMTRISSGFDLCMLNTKLPIPNLKLVPGFLYAYISTKELNPTKEFSVSYLLSFGGGSFETYRQRQGLNYTLRKDIWDHEADFKIPTKFYLSYRDKDKYPKSLLKRVLPTDSKKWIFNSEFTVAIENTKQEDYLTEKLLGCFLSMTIPIYIGCPNVTDYFDPRGMIIASSLEDVIRIVNTLTPKTYQEMLPFLQENKRRAEKLLTLEKEIITNFKTENNL